MKKFYWLVALCCVLHIEVGFAQITQAINKDSIAELRGSYNKNFIQFYKENSDLSYIAPKGEIGSPVKYVVSGKLTTTYMLLETNKLPVAFAVVPDFTVRVINERSVGVRTPSFRLGGVLYFRLNKSLANYRYGTLKFTHHSNGQDGDAINADGLINTRNGNFATNYLTLSYHFGNRIPMYFSRIYYSLNHEAGFEWHRWFAYEPALENDYGFTRLIYNLSLRKYKDEKENWRLNAGANYAVNTMAEYHLTALKKRLNAEISFHYRFPFMSNAFFMAAAGYYGEDPYNIYYRDKYAYLRFGISSGFLRNRN